MLEGIGLSLDYVGIFAQICQSLGSQFELEMGTYNTSSGLRKPISMNYGNAIKPKTFNIFKSLSMFELPLRFSESNIAIHGFVHFKWQTENFY